MTDTPPAADQAEQLAALLKAQQDDFTQSGPVSLDIRIDRMRRARAMIGNNSRQIIEASQADFGNRSEIQTQMSEVLATMDGFQLAIKQVKRWTKPERRKAPFPFNFIGGKARVEYVPKGSVGVLGTWNFPVYTSVSPLAGIFAAGNRSMIKLSELTPATSALIKEIIAKDFDPTELVGVTGGPEVGAQFAGLPFDHIIFTGGTGIGKHILRAAADNLTPCTLELGGKSPVILTRNYDLQKAVERIFVGKALNQGQACLAPDYVFVAEEQQQDFVDKAVAFYSELFPSIVDNQDYSCIINERHYQRVKGIVDDARDKGATVVEINPANEDMSRQPEGIHKIPMTLVLNATDDMRVTQEEIFGPVLAIYPYKNTHDCVRYINARPRPLGLYIFSDNQSEQRYLLDNTISGGVTLNDVLMHTSCDDLPFGGVGDSGMGHYHGEHGFRTFSHPRAVYRQSKLDIMKLGGMLPPYTDQAREQIDKQCKV